MQRLRSGSPRRGLRVLAAGLTLAASIASWGDETPWRWTLPAGFPTPRVPGDNPMSDSRVALGKRLFFDTRLSVTGAYACASCHDPDRAFTDGRARALGATGESHPRSAMSLVNVAYNASFGWANPALRELEDQAAVPMFGQHPVELGLDGLEAPVMATLMADGDLRAGFAAAFPESRETYGFVHVRRALASYQRTLISAHSPYDRYVFLDDRNALDAAAQRGMDLFFSERVGCARCHPAPLFMSPAVYEGSSTEPSFHNTGLYNLDGAGRYPDDALGLMEHTGRPEDMGHFRVPTLRNVAKTAPYMHDGSIETLPDVVRHYAAGMVQSGNFAAGASSSMRGRGRRGEWRYSPRQRTPSW